MFQVGKTMKKRIKVKNRTFQGDTLSSLLFVRAMSLISCCLNRRKKSDKEKQAELKYINHQSYLDDLKLYGKDKEKVERLIKAVEQVTVPIELTLNEQKCAIKCYRSAKKIMETSPTKTRTSGTNNIPQVLDEESYKYLGINQELWPVKDRYEELAQQCVNITKEILSSDLSWNQTFYGSRALVVRKLRYIYKMGSVATGVEAKW